MLLQAVLILLEKVAHVYMMGPSSLCTFTHRIYDTGGSGELFSPLLKFFRDQILFPKNFDLANRPIFIITLLHLDAEQV